MRPGFAYRRAATLPEASRLLLAEPAACILAGGTDLMVHLRQPSRGVRPPAVIDIKRIPGLAAVAVDDRAVRLGACTSLAALIDHPVVSAEFPVLPQAARYMGSPAIRHLATVGGNLCNASPAADLPPVLLVLDAEVGVTGPGGQRRLALADFFTGPGRTALQPGELLAWVAFPRWPSDGGDWVVRYERLDVRRAMDIALAAVALAVRREGDRVLEARVALGAVAPTPVRAPLAESALRGQALTGAVIERAAQAAMETARPIGDVRATAEYRRSMTGALLRRGLESIATGDRQAA